jgi:hypothetical protein
MHARSFDHLTRRASLAVLNAAAMATLAAPFAAEARKRKTDNDRAKQAKKKCKTQVRQCTALIAATCGPDQENCAELLECCKIAGRCDFAGFLNCTIAAQV